MKKLLISLAAVLLLAACSSTDVVKTMGTAEVTFTRLVNQADVIAQRPRCDAAVAAVVLCIDQADVDNLVNAAVVGDKALDEGWAAIAKFENGGEDEEALIDAAVSAALGAVAVFETAITGFVGE